MADPRFYTVAGPFTVAELAEIARAELGGAADGACMIRDVAPLQTAGPGEISFFDNRAYQSAFQASNASACLVGTELSAQPPGAMTLLVTEKPYRAYADVARAFYPDIDVAAAAAGDGAHVDPTASLADAVVVEPGAVIGARAEIGPRTRIGANAVIGPGVCLGADCAVGAGASVRFCLAGSRVRIAAGARIGEDGFGYAPGEDGHVKIPQLGRVLLGDGVEIGANTTIDRGAGPDTVIGDGCIIDNLVQVAHNVRMGRNCIIVAQVGLSGSTTLGDNVVIGGQAGTAGHIKVGDGVRIGAQSGVISDLEPGVTVIGSPAQPQGEVWRQVAWVKRMAARKKKE